MRTVSIDPSPERETKPYPPAWGRKPERPRYGLAPRVSRVRAWARLEDALRSIATDLLGPNESDEFPEACADWVTATTRAAASRVCDSALEALVESLDALLVDVPPEIARRLDEARVRHDIGFA